jgi:hypothetical protein
MYAAGALRLATLCSAIILPPSLLKPTTMVALFEVARVIMGFCLVGMTFIARGVSVSLELEKHGLSLQRVSL